MTVQTKTTIEIKNFDIHTKIHVEYYKKYPSETHELLSLTKIVQKSLRHDATSPSVSQYLRTLSQGRQIAGTQRPDNWSVHEESRTIKCTPSYRSHPTSTRKRRSMYLSVLFDFNPSREGSSFDLTLFWGCKILDLTHKRKRMYLSIPSDFNL